MSCYTSAPPTISSTASFCTGTKRQRPAQIAASNSKEAGIPLTHRSFVTKVVGGVASLLVLKGLSSAQVKGKLGYMKTVDTAAMLTTVEKGFFKGEGFVIYGPACDIQGRLHDARIGTDAVIYPASS
jgi:hypothetical protein